MNYLAPRIHDDGEDCCEDCDKDLEFNIKSRIFPLYVFGPYILVLKPQHLSCGSVHGRKILLEKYFIFMVRTSIFFNSRNYEFEQFSFQFFLMVD